MSQFPLVHPITGLRRFLYLVSPNESSFQTEAEVPRYLNEVSFIQILIA